VRKFFTSKKDEHVPHVVGGVICYAIALFLFACLDVITKYLTRSYPMPLIGWARYFSQFVLMTAILGPMIGLGLIRTKRTGLVVLRSSCLVLITMLVVSAFARMPMAETTAITFLAPLIVVLLSKPILKERIGAVRWVAVVMGFIGVLLIAHPGGQLDTYGVIFAFIAAGFYAVYQLLSRILHSTETAAALLYYSGLIGTVGFGLSLPWFWEGPSPSLFYYVLFVGMGVLGGSGHFLFTEAFRHAPASMLAPITYLQLVWSVLLGWLAFSHLPDRIGLAGMFIIGVAGVVVTIYGNRASAKQAPVPE
jgi:drug/metabolite transporter (DMT)-like permease